MSKTKVYTDTLNPTNTPQTQPIPGREADMAKNNAGGFSFTLDLWGRLDRFLILGSDSGTYYAGKTKHATDNIKVVRDAVKADGIRAVNAAVAVSDAGRAASNDPALLVLAVASAEGSEDVKRHAYQSLPKVARIGTHLYHFAEFRNSLGGWGNGLKRAVARWYTDQDIDRVALQAIKYRQRDGWSHRDLLRLSHAIPQDEDQQALFAWITQGKESENLPRIVKGFIQVQGADNAKAVAGLITDYTLPWEAVPTNFLNDAVVWDAILHAGKYGMPIQAMIRNLGKMSSVGLLTTGSDATRHVIKALGNADAVKASRIHPISVLYGLKTYGQNKGFRGSLTWKSVSEIRTALDKTFYIAFGNVEATGKRTMLALDVSGSMTYTGDGLLMASEKAAAMAMVTARAEEPGDWFIRGFASDFRNLGIRSDDTLSKVLKRTENMSFGRTDCALPMKWALQNKVKVDAFVVYTDNETWAGREHPAQALKAYRDAMGIPAKLVVVGTESTGFTIADPKDAGMLDVVGFDTNAPVLISNFIRG